MDIQVVWSARIKSVNVGAGCTEVEGAATFATAGPAGERFGEGVEAAVEVGVSLDGLPDANCVLGEDFSGDGLAGDEATVTFGEIGEGEVAAEVTAGASVGGTGEDAAELAEAWGIEGS
jgi:hypothetical protein